MRVITMFILIIILLSSCSYNKQNEQQISNNDILFAENNDSLTKIIINRKPVKYCDETHYHFIDIVIKEKIDSLKEKGITNILFYRDWIATNGFNGYGKLIWSYNGKCQKHQFNFENHDGRYGISSIDKLENQSCEEIDFYVENRIDTVMSFPKEPKLWMSHAADHFIYLNINQNENCFNVSGLQIMADSTHIKSQLIDKLKISSYDYFDMIEERRKSNIK